MRHNSRRQRIRLAKEYTRLFISACVGHRKRHIENSQPSSGGERRTRALHTDRRRLKVLTHLAQLGVLLFIDNAVRVRGGGGEGGLRASATTRPVVSVDDGSVGSRAREAAGCGTRDEGSVSNPAALLKGHKYIQCPFTIQPKL